MSAQRPLQAARALAAASLLIAGGCDRKVVRYSALEWSADKSRVAYARDRMCAQGPCETLYVGSSIESAEALEGLADGQESCAEIAWSKDARRVAFLINGRQLRIYDAQTRKPAGKVNLFDDSAARIARGITFSDNGAAVTFDDCPRDHAGCRAGMVGIRE